MTTILTNTDNEIDEEILTQELEKGEIAQKTDTIISNNSDNEFYDSAHDKKIKKSDKTRHNSNFFDELNHAKSYQT